MLDVVKFSWRNTHGYWIPVEWVLVPTTDNEAAIRSRACIGRPSMTDLKILDRSTIPEELRVQGRSQFLLSSIILHDQGADEYSALEMVNAMRNRVPA